MTTQEMHDLLDILIDEVNTGRFLDAEKDRVLNLAINDVVDDRISPLKLDKKYSIESAMRVRDELRSLIKVDTGVTVGASTYEADNLITLPADHRYSLLLYTTIAGVKRVALPKNHDWLGGNFDNPHTKPSAERTKWIEIDDKIAVFAGGNTIASAELHYVKNPATIELGVTNPDIPVSLQEEVVRKAASILQGIMEDQAKREAGMRDELES